jgi:hypothetical protein
MLIQLHSTPTPTDPFRGATKLFDLQLNGEFGQMHGHPKVSVVYHKPVVTSQPFPPVTAGSIVNHNGTYVVSLRGLIRLMATTSLGAQILFGRDISLTNEPYSKVLLELKEMSVDGSAISAVSFALSRADLKNIERDFDPRFWPAHYGELVFLVEAALKESGAQTNTPKLGWRNVTYDYCIYHRMELFSYLSSSIANLDKMLPIKSLEDNYYNNLYTKMVDLLHAPTD